MILALVLVPVPQVPTTNTGTCLYDLLTFYCWRTGLVTYYSIINRIALSIVSTIMATIVYSVVERSYIASASMLFFASWLLITTVSPLSLPMETIVGGLLPALAGLFLLKDLVFKLPTGLKESFSGQIMRALTRRATIIILLTTLFLGMTGGLWMYANEGTADGVQATCLNSSLPGGNGFAVNGTVGITNPLYVPVHGQLKITYNYTGARLAQSDLETFNIPSRGTTFVDFTFTGVTREQIGITNSSYPIIVTFERHYEIMFWSFTEHNTLAESERPPQCMFSVCLTGIELPHC